MRLYVLLFAVASACFAQAGIAATSQAAAAPAGDAPALHDSACEFEPPAPILLPKAYPGQTLSRQSDNRVTEKAQLPDGLRIEIRQSACADFVTTDFILTVPRDRQPQLDWQGWIGLARSTIAGLKIGAPASDYADVSDFLIRVQGLRPHSNVVAVCRDGSDAPPGECSWESMGGFVFSVKRTGRDTRISVMRYWSA